MPKCCTPNAYPPLDRDADVNIAEETIEWLYREQLGIDEQWSYLLPTGFTWWSDQYAQTVEFLGQETGPNGECGYLVSVRTELLRELDLTETALEEINSLPMRAASMAGPVYDVAARRLDLWSMVRVTDDNGGWLRFLLAAAAVTQLAEARLLAPVLAEATGALPATSEHPESGMRTAGGGINSAASVFVRSGDEQCAWSDAEFRDAVDNPALPVPSASADGRRFSADFPFGDKTSQCRILGDQAHPLYGNGLLVLQIFPVGQAAPSESDGVKLALSLNAADLTGAPTGYGLGSYAYADGLIHFSGFVPNALHRRGLLGALVASCAARAQAMAARFADGHWDADRYSLDPAVLSRRLEERRATAPVIERPRGCPMMRATTGG